MAVESLRPSARPHITWTTLARAERLAAALAGDDLEPDAADTTAEARYREILAKLFRPDELDDLDDGDPDDPAYLRQLLATAEALDPDPNGELA